MIELEKLESFFQEIQARLSEEENRRIGIAFRDARDAFAYLETKYLDAIRDRAVVHSLLERTSADLLRRYKTIFEYSGTAMAVLERDGTISLANSYFINLVGYPREEIEGHHFFSRYSDTGLGSLVEKFLKHAGDTPAEYQDSGEARISAHDGREVDVVIRISRFPQSGQCILSIIDISERKRAEEALQKSEQLLATAMDLANVANWEFEPGTGQFVLNDRLYNLFGTTAEREGGYRMAGETYIREFVHPDDRQAAAAVVGTPVESVAPGTDFRMEHRIIRRDGSVRHIAIWIRGVTVSTGQIQRFSGATQDITERKQAEDAIRQVNRKLNLLSGITRHDIKNQLLSLNGFLEISKKYAADAVKMAEFIEKETRIVKTMERQIAFTKEYEAIGVNAPVWQDCRTVLETTAKQNLPEKVTVNNDLPAGLEVFADPLIVEVFHNLIDNAVRHGGTITTIRFFAEESPGGAVVVCEDDGDGVPADLKERIFQRGFGKNTGMGLFLVREILSITGIIIRETGEPGKGARFEMVMPKGTFRYIKKDP